MSYAISDIIEDVTPCLTESGISAHALSAIFMVSFTLYLNASSNRAPKINYYDVL